MNSMPGIAGETNDFKSKWISKRWNCKTRARGSP